MTCLLASPRVPSGSRRQALQGGVLPKVRIVLLGYVSYCRPVTDARQGGCWPGRMKGSRVFPRPEPPAAVGGPCVAAGTAASVSDRRGVGVRLSGGTVADIVRQARVSRAAFYAHFADKEDRFRPRPARAGSSDRPRGHRDPCAARRDPRRGGTPGRVPGVPGVPRRRARLRQCLLHPHAGGGPRAVDRLEAASRLFADLNQRWHRRAPERYPAWPAVPEEAYLALTGATDELVRSMVRAGRTDACRTLKRRSRRYSRGPGGPPLACGRLSRRR